MLEACICVSESWETRMESQQGIGEQQWQEGGLGGGLDAWELKGKKLRCGKGTYGFKEIQKQKWIGKKNKLEGKERMGGGGWDEDDMPWNKPIQAWPLFSLDLLGKADFTFLCHIFTPQRQSFPSHVCGKFRADLLPKLVFVVQCLMCGSLSINGGNFRII